MNSIEKLENLRSIIRRAGKIAVAFSGGTDSTFLLKISADVLGKDKVLAITIASPIRFETEIRNSVQIARDLGIKQIIVEANELENDDFSKNDVLRCYHCKYSIFKNLIEIARKNDIDFVADGTNYDDVLNDYRPGLRALEELKISSPLKDAQLTKSEIRNFSREFGLPTWDKQPETCLATRFPYGIRITNDKLEKIRKIESYLSTLVKVHRARYHDDRTLRVEVMQDELGIILENRVELLKLAKSLGFNYVTLDLEGYRSGSLNEVLK